MTTKITTDNIDAFIQDIFKRATKDIKIIPLIVPLDMFVSCFKKGDQSASIVRRNDFTDDLMIAFKKAANADNIEVQESKNKKGKNLISLNKLSIV